MSEISSGLPILGGVWLLYEYGRRGNFRFGILGSSLLAFSTFFRASNLILLVFVPAAALARHGFGRESLKASIPLGLASFLGLGPLMVFNWATFGNPLYTGYKYWLNEGANPWLLFRLQELNKNIPYYLSELMQEKTTYTLADMYGERSHIGPAFVVLCLLAAAGLRRDRLFWCFIGTAAFQLGAMSCYRFLGIRFLFPIILIAVPFAAAGSTGLMRRLVAQKRWTGALILFVVILATVLGWPGQRSDTELGDMVWSRSVYDAGPQYRLVKELGKAAAGTPAVVLTDLDPPYVHALLPSAVNVAPLLDTHPYRFSPRVTFDKQSRQRLIRDSFQRGVPVFALVVLNNINDLKDLCPPASGTRWQVLIEDHQWKGGIARLVSENDSKDYTHSP